MDTEDDLDRLCDDIQERARVLVTEMKRLTAERVTPERRDRLYQLRRDIHLLQLQVQELLQTRRPQ